MDRIVLFTGFLGPVLTLLPALFVSSKGGGVLDTGFCLITVLALILCYSFSTQGLIAASILLSASIYFLDLQLVWSFGVVIALFSGLIVTTFSWNLIKKPAVSEEPADSLKGILIQTKQNLQQEIQEKNALKLKLLEAQQHLKKTVDISPLQKQLEEKTAALNQVKQELFHIKSKFETLKKDQDQDQRDLENRLAEKEEIIELFKRQESELLSLLKKENQKTPIE